MSDGMEAAGDTDLRVRCERLLEVAAGRSAGESEDVARGEAGGDSEVHLVTQHRLISLKVLFYFVRCYVDIYWDRC